MNPVFEAQNITLKFEKEEVFSDLCFEIISGDSVALTGASGSGKSSILNMLLGFIFPLSGELKYNSQEYSPELVQEIRRKVAFLPQNVNLPIEKTRDLLDYIFTFKSNRSVKYSDEKIAKLFSSLNLSLNLLNKDTDEISGGQKQRILLASVLLCDKDIILLDEPTSGLDDDAKTVVNNMLINTNKTLIVSTHDSNLMALC